MSPKTQAWISALRLRTLPLAAGGILLGSFVPETVFQPLVFVFALITALGLQILSNLANDYGDFVKGTDNDKRIGPVRALQSGIIQKEEMKNALRICAALTFFSGVVLIAVSFGSDQWVSAAVMLVIGLLAIWAAIRYTVGKKPYGYAGLGDIFVVGFFGIVSVCGVAFLHTGFLDKNVWYPALSYGFLAAGVLNINNMRDIDNDREAGKRTLVVQLGANGARLYHGILIGFAFIFQAVYLHEINPACFFGLPKYGRYLALVGFIPVFINSVRVLQPKAHASEYNPFLKGLSLGAFFEVLVFVIVLMVLPYFV